MTTTTRRREYSAAHFSERDAGADPLRLLERWLAAARRRVAHEPDAMTLATTSPGGRVSARMVLLRGMDRRGLVLFTNYRSRKAREMRAGRRAALVLYWPQLHRQVRVEGRVGPIAAAESDAYFRTRPRAAQLSAWASPQSRVIPDRAWLEARLAAARQRFAGRDVPRPASWGGYRLVPDRIEFWQGRVGRLHDRIRFERTVSSRWRRDRLAP